MKKICLIIVGTIVLALAVMGIFIPGLPTTPLLLLSAYIYSRSSPKLYKALLDSNYLGRKIKNYTERGGMTLRAKLTALFLMWTMITISTTILISISWVRILVLILGAIGSFVIVFVVKRVED